MKLKRNNIFITIEGCDGVGKSTVINRLKLLFKDAYFTREPGGDSFCEEIRNATLNHSHINNMAQLLAFNASRAQHVNNIIIPKLRENIVFCDRFIDSTTVYQGMSISNGKKIDMKIIEYINNLACSELNIDVTFVLYADINTIISRMKNRGSQNNFDSFNTETYKEINNSFINLKNKYPNRIILINTDRDIDSIVDEIYNCILRKLND